MREISNINLPKISIVTITKNRKELFPLPINCVNNFQYPQHLIQWIVIEDGEQNVKELLDKYCSIPNKNIIYQRFEGNIGQKRNRGVSLTTNDIVIMMNVLE